MNDEPKESATPTQIQAATITQMGLLAVDEQPDNVLIQIGTGQETRYFLLKKSALADLGAKIGAFMQRDAALSAGTSSGAPN